jgi:UDP-3-O-[3-hydroxymyristoyl] N-acetylglucosamine deacetylase
VDVPATALAVRRVDHATTLAAPGPDGAAVTVQTVEHLLAALVGLGVDNCVVQLDADEVPILDGSASPWVYLIREAGLRATPRPRLVRRVTRSLTITSGQASIAVHPASLLRLTCSIDFAHPVIGHQTVSLTVTPRTFAEQLAPARTFGFLREVEALRRAGLVRGGSYANAIVLDEHEVLNGKLRFPDELVRHKALDLLGDLALTGHPILGHVVAHRAGHALHCELGRRLLEDPTCSRIEEVADEAPALAPVMAPAAAAWSVA